MVATKRIRGRVTGGQGAGASFTNLDWVERQLGEKLAVIPSPGTLNLIVDDGDSRATWNALRAQPGIVLEPPSGDFCVARCYPVLVRGTVPAVIVLPDVPGYPQEQIELIAAGPLREALRLADGETLELEIVPSA